MSFVRFAVMSVLVLLLAQEYCCHVNSVPLKDSAGNMTSEELDKLEEKEDDPSAKYSAEAQDVRHDEEEDGEDEEPEDDDKEEDEKDEDDKEEAEDKEDDEKEEKDDKNEGDEKKNEKAEIIDDVFSR